jgi:hypothetical protein
MTSAGGNKPKSEWDKINPRKYNRLSSFGFGLTEARRARQTGREPTAVEKVVGRAANDIAVIMRDKIDSFETDEECAEFANKKSLIFSLFFFMTQRPLAVYIRNFLLISKMFKS